MRPIVVWLHFDPAHPLIDEAGILSGADVIGVIDPAREYEFVERGAAGGSRSSN
jgi:hypothetical protein